MTTIGHVHEWDDNGDCLHSFCYGRQDVYAPVRGLAAELDSRWPAMHQDTSYLPPDYGPTAHGWQPFSSGEDAHNVASTRTERANMARNEDIRNVVALLRDTHDVRAAHGQLLISLWHQCHVLGLEGPTLLVGVAR